MVHKPPAISYIIFPFVLYISEAYKQGFIKKLSKAFYQCLYDSKHLL